MSVKKLLILAFLSFGNYVASQDLPNVILFFTDDEGYGDTSINGNPVILTPNIDRLGFEGIRFTSMYVTGTVCTPSRAGLLTGRLPIRSGLAGENWTGAFGGDPVFWASSIGGMPDTEITIPEALKSVGYRTAMFGKWHLGHQEQFLPTSHGFDSYLGVPYSADMGESYWFEVIDNPKRGKTLPILKDTEILEQPANLATITERYADGAIEFMTESTNSGTPFFLYMALEQPHAPNFCAADICGTSPRGEYGDNMLGIDRAVGRILDALDDLEIDENTIIIYISDNGPAVQLELDGGSPGPFRAGKASIFEGGVRVPGFIRWKDRIRPGRTVADATTTMDIFTTVLSLADIPIPVDRQIDGIDLSPILFETGELNRGECIFFYNGTPTPTNPEEEPGLWAIRCGDYKLYYVTNEPYGPPHVEDPPLLFHVDIDISEKFPISPLSNTYIQLFPVFEAARQRHLGGIIPVVNQMALGDDFDLVLCCDPNSQDQYPEYPQCTCDPENWHPYGKDVVMKKKNIPHDYTPDEIQNHVYF